MIQYVSRYIYSRNVIFICDTEQDSYDRMQRLYQTLQVFKQLKQHY